MRGPFFCYLSLSGARLSFKLMPKLAGGYGGEASRPPFTTHASGQNIP